MKHTDQHRYFFVGKGWLLGAVWFYGFAVEQQQQR